MTQTLIFWAIAAIIILGAIGVMVLKNVFRAALSLIMCLIGVAGVFIFLNAEFIAGAQILIYVGAISVIIILAIMLTREFDQGNDSNKLRLPAIAVAAIFFGFVVYFLVRTNWQVSGEVQTGPATPLLAEQLFGPNGFILPLEITAVLILVVIISAIVIAKEKDE